MARPFGLKPMLWADEVKETISWYVTTPGFGEGNFPYDGMRAFAIRDRNGYIIQFGQDLGA